LLDPIMPERSLAMLYAPRGIGETLLGLSIGLAIASGNPLLRCTGRLHCSRTGSRFEKWR
jgi:putative DNA primase/helicase